jgi:hypothetical protein
LTPAQRLRIGSVLLAVTALGMSGATVAILTRLPDVTTALGRHLWAGALANLSLSLIQLMIALIPLRRGEKWAFWAYVLPLLVYGIPILMLDATHVPGATLVPTLAPMVLGLASAVIGLMLAAKTIFAEAP